MFADDRKMLAICLALAVACFVAIGIMGKGAAVSQYLFYGAGISILGVFKSSTFLIRESRIQNQREETKKEETQSLIRRVNYAKWFLVAAFIAFLPVIATIPIVVKTFGALIPTEVSAKLVFINILIIPACGLFVMMPLVSKLNRSVVRWGIAFIVVPLGSLIIGGVLFFLGKAEIRERIKWGS